MSHTIQGITDALTAYGKCLPGVAVIKVKFEIEPQISDLPDPSSWASKVVFQGFGDIGIDGEPTIVEEHEWCVLASFDDTYDELGKSVRAFLLGRSQVLKGQIGGLDFASELLAQKVDMNEVMTPTYDEEVADAEVLAQMSPEQRAQFEADREQLLAQFQAPVDLEQIAADEMEQLKQMSPAEMEAYEAGREAAVESPPENE